MDGGSENLSELKLSADLEMTNKGLRATADLEATNEEEVELKVTADLETTTEEERWS